VPVFGEWSYYSSSSSPEEPQLPHSGAMAGDSAWWYAAAAEPDACSDAWFRCSPPLRRPPSPKKARRPAPAPAEQKLSAGQGGVLGLPFQSGLAASGDPRDLRFDLSTAFASGPALRLSYRPNDPALPFAHAVHAGLNWGLRVPPPPPVSDPADLRHAGASSMWIWA